jgi:thioredoxin reductase (NADPH)
MASADPVGVGARDGLVGVVETDALVIGAGPVGLFQLFQLGLQGITTQVIDALPVAGGQCIELYADKPIYDIPGLPVCSGRELVQRLLQQVAPFAPAFHLGQTITALAQRSDGRFDLETSSGARFISRLVFIAAGVGAFLPRALKVEGLERHLGSQVFYQATDATTLAGRKLLVVGGEDAAVAAAVQAADLCATAEAGARPASVTLLHRRSLLTAEPALLARFQVLVDSGALRFEVGQVLAIDEDASPEHRLDAVQLVGEDGVARRMAVDLLLIQLGLSPKLGPIAQWGLALARRQLVVDTANFETSTPGIFAVGDVVSYPGKKKLIVCGFHEATLAAFAGAARLHPGEPQPLQYTTTSPKLHRLLGVATPSRER